MKWRLHSVGRFYDANENTVVYFDSHSGDTHLITDFAAFLIQQFNDQALSTEDLVELLSPLIESSDNTELNGALVTVLDELVSLDILKRE